jgi:hypothetical protein
MNKKGMELVWSTIVVIIIALVLLAFLLTFFFSSSRSFVYNIKSYFSYSNVDNVVASCNVLVDSGQSYVYCCESKNVKYYEGGEKAEGLFTCDSLAEKEFVDNLDELSCEGVSC